MLEENEEVDAPVGEDGVQGFLYRRGAGIVCFAGVVNEAPLGVGLFFIFEPAGCGWVVWEEDSINVNLH